MCIHIFLQIRCSITRHEQDPLCDGKVDEKDQKVELNSSLKRCIRQQLAPAAPRGFPLENKWEMPLLIAASGIA